MREVSSSAERILVSEGSLHSMETIGGSYEFFLEFRFAISKNHSTKIQGKWIFF
jgi:hypothetical protein